LLGHHNLEQLEELQELVAVAEVPMVSEPLPTAKAFESIRGATGGQQICWAKCMQGCNLMQIGRGLGDMERCMDVSNCNMLRCSDHVETL
jgi:hypothetical protein